MGRDACFMKTHLRIQQIYIFLLIETKNQHGKLIIGLTDAKSRNPINSSRLNSVKRKLVRITLLRGMKTFHIHKKKLIKRAKKEKQIFKYRRNDTKRKKNIINRHTIKITN